MKDRDEIKVTRAEGFGGSDAAMVCAIAERLAAGMPLTITQRKRLRVIKKIDEYVGIPSTPEMDAGHAFEDVVAEELPDYAREVMMRIGRYEKKFSVFAHADFFKVKDSDKITVVECKWSRKYDMIDLRNIYRWQLQQYYMLGANEVKLCTCCVNSDGEEVRELAHIDRCEEDINKLRECYDIIFENWEKIDVQLSEYYSDELKEFMKSLSDLKEKSEKAAADYDFARERAMQLMSEEGVFEFSHENISAVVVPSSITRTFDSVRFKKENPDVAQQYMKEVQKKSFLNLKINKK